MDNTRETHDETALAEAIRAGSVKAFDAVYRLYVRRLYAYCYEAIRIRQETEEVVHDVFMVLWNSREAIDPSQGVGPLLYAIARRKRIDAFRRLVNSPLYEDYVSLANTASAPASAPMEYEEFYSALQAALRGLPEKRRQIVTMSRFDGLSNAEIADSFGLAEKTVRNLLSLSLKELYQRLHDLTDDSAPSLSHKTKQK